MEQLAISPKHEPDAAARFVTCKLCLASSSEMRLSFRNLSQFYTVFKSCGLGLNVMTSETHYNWVCAYCWTRASQCLQFVEMVRRAEYILHNVLKNEQITDVKLKEASNGYIKKPVSLSSCVIAAHTELRPGDTCGPTASNQRSEYSKQNFMFCHLDREELNPVVEHQTDIKLLPTDTEDNMDSMESEHTEDASALLLEQAWSFKDEMKEVDAKVKEVKKALKVKRISKQEQARWRLLQVEVLTLTEEEQRKELAVRRQTERYRSLPYKCDSCAVGYNEKESFEKHGRRHDESNGPYTCNICNERFANRRRVTAHKRGHRQRWRCLICSETIKSVKGVQSHYIKCTGSKPLACAQCSEYFSTKSHLRKHIIKAHKLLHDFKCDTCRRVFVDKESLTAHIQYHMREKPHKCSICNKQSSTLYNHKLHMSTHTGPTEPKEQRYCVECDKYYKTKKSLDIHLTSSSKHVTDRNRHKCNTCSKNFVTKGNLDDHIKVVHLNTRDFSCDQCDKDFSLKRMLRKHIKSKHTERTRDHICAVCNVAFFTKKTLRHHTIGVHERRRPYECDICGETFGYTATLHTHRKLKHKIANKGSGSAFVKITKS